MHRYWNENSYSQCILLVSIDHAADGDQTRYNDNHDQLGIHPGEDKLDLPSHQSIQHHYDSNHKEEETECYCIQHLDYHFKYLSSSVHLEDIIAPCPCINRYLSHMRTMKRYSLSLCHFSQIIFQTFGNLFGVSKQKCSHDQQERETDQQLNTSKQ
uniref:Uncharacterized protein n=1 Tax=Cacopsylla melanoneura TaxID=428564 RepID=A0A8D8S0Y1_9HEMI